MLQAAYEAADYWKEFKEILEIAAPIEETSSDVNGDGKVDIVYVTTIIDMILKAK